MQASRGFESHPIRKNKKPSFFIEFIKDGFDQERGEKGNTMRLLHGLQYVVNGVYRLFFSFFLLWIFGFIGFCVAVNYFFPVPSLEKITDGIAVFTGSKGRIGEALNVFRKQHQIPLLLISGINSDMGVPFEKQDHLEKITLDYAKNTRENIKFTQKWANRYHIHTIRLITSDYHLPRCLLETLRSHEHLEWLFHPVKSEKTLRKRLYHLFREYNKFIITILMFPFYQSHDSSFY